MPNGLVSQIERFVARINNANDPAPGQSVLSPTGVGSYMGQLGQRVALGNDEPRLPSGLYGGVFQLVQFRAAATLAAARGLVAFWSSDTSYVVTNDEPTGVSDIAGVALNAVSKGNYGWVQTEGRVMVLFGTITKATPAVGDYVLCSANGDAKADVLADATNLTSVQARHFLGIATPAAPVASQLNSVRLGFGRWNF